jgi:hypothetical protein
VVAESHPERRASVLEAGRLQVGLAHAYEAASSRTWLTSRALTARS